MVSKTNQNRQSLDGIRATPIARAKTKPKFIGRFGSFTRRNVVLIVAILLAVALLSVVGLKNDRSDKASTGSDVNSVITEVSKHYLVPENEKPALATVTDKAKLNTQFLKHAQNGDKILIYQNNSVAIIYRPAVDRIVAVGPVDIRPTNESTKQ